MKSKFTTYLLIAAVAGIWGTIIYKIITGINPEIPEIVTAQSLSEFNPKPIAENEIYTISEVERDPFLGTLSKKNKSKPKLFKKPNNSKPENVPKVSYSGIVKNGRNEVFVITINGKQHLMRNGQTVDDVKLMSGNSKEIVVRFNNSNSTILVD